MLPYQMIAGGRFTLSVTGGVASGVNVSCVSQNPPDFIIARAITGWGQASDAQPIEWWWERSMAQNSARGLFQASNGATPVSAAVTATSLSSGDAISTFDTFNPPTYAALTATTTNNTTFVVAMASTSGIAVGDIVRMYSVTDMQQISGYDFQVTAVTANVSITLGMQATAVTAGANSFAASGTAAQVLKFIPNRMYPRWRWIAGITRVSQAVVYFTVANDFTPGEIISLRIPEEFGSGAWTSINNKAARVLSVTNSATESSVVLDLDTSGITSAFVSPTSAVASPGSGVSPAVAVPSSSGVVPNAGSATVPQEPPGTNLRDAFDNRNVRIIRFGADLFNQSGFDVTDADVWSWQAYKYDDYKIGSV